jgi:hypothetical protein
MGVGADQINQGQRSRTIRQQCGYSPPPPFFLDDLLHLVMSLFIHLDLHAENKTDRLMHWWYIRQKEERVWVLTVSGWYGCVLFEGK